MRGHTAGVAGFQRVSGAIQSLRCPPSPLSPVERQGIVGNCAARSACSSEFPGDGQQGATPVVGILEGLLPQSKLLKINLFFFNFTTK